MTEKVGNEEGHVARWLAVSEQPENFNERLQDLTEAVVEDVNGLIVMYFNINREIMSIDPITFSTRFDGSLVGKYMNLNQFSVPRMKLLKNPIYYEMWQGHNVLDLRITKLNPELVPKVLHFIFLKPFDPFVADIFPVMVQGELQQILVIVRKDDHPIGPHVDNLDKATLVCTKMLEDGLFSF